VAKAGENFEWNTWTVQDGRHVPNFSCVITPNGVLVKGTVNCFALVIMLIKAT
jgi:hypothetical protein